MGTGFSNGKIPAERLVQLDSGHWSSPASAERWYAFRAAVKARTGVTLRITPGPNAYRSDADQQSTRRDACARGNCLQAAWPGTSPHGGTWSHWRWTGGRTVEAMAFDVDNWWAVPWSVFQEEAERVGFLVGTIRADVAGVDEWWHIVDLDPWAPVLAGEQEDDMLEEDRNRLKNIENLLQVQGAGYGYPQVTAQRVDSILGRILPAGMPWDMLQQIDGKLTVLIDSSTDDGFDAVAAFAKMTTELQATFQKQFEELGVALRAEIIAAVADGSAVDEAIDKALSTLRIVTTQGERVAGGTGARS